MLVVTDAPKVGAQNADAVFQRFWDAADPREAARVIPDIVRSGVTFDEALARLKSGRTYSESVARGRVRLTRRSGGRLFYYDLQVPATYTPARRYRVRVQLHGSAMAETTSEPRSDTSMFELAGEADDQITVVPYAWTGAPWWTDAQLENLRGILDGLKRTYNVDENAVALSGVSDGGTGAFYIAMRDTTPFSSFLPFNGFVLVLANASVNAEGDLFPNNFRNKPFFVVNGGLDPMYPPRLVDPYIEHLINGGVAIDYRPQPGAGHNTSWFPDLKADIEAFARDRRRDPLPRVLTWENGGDEPTNRAHWLVLDQILPTREAIALLPDIDEFPITEEQPSSPRLITHLGRYGRVDLERDGNTVRAQARGVVAFTLLLSPDVFDFSKPVTVIVNDRVRFEGRVQTSLATLLKWAARDNDRTMLFGAELRVAVR